MQVDLMIGSSRWSDSAALARSVEAAGLSGMVFTETGQTPWLNIAAAAVAAPSLTYSTGIAVAFGMGCHRCQSSVAVSAAVVANTTASMPSADRIAWRRFHGPS